MGPLTRGLVASFPSLVNPIVVDRQGVSRRMMKRGAAPGPRLSAHASLRRRGVAQRRRGGSRACSFHARLRLLAARLQLPAVALTPAARGSGGPDAGLLRGFAAEGSARR